MSGVRTNIMMFQQKKKDPKDHVRENVRRMRRIQRQSKKKEVETEVNKPVPVENLWKSNRYDGVQSRVKEELRKTPEPRPSSANYLRAHSRTGWLPTSYDDTAISPEPPEEKLTIPKAETARDIKLIRRDLDFIKLNGKAARRSAMKRSPSATALDDLLRAKDRENTDYKRGEVPKYLQNRQKEWTQQEEERKASIPDPQMPPGHKLMPQPERVETLNKLKQKEAELTRQLHSLPIRTDTLRMRTRKEELENKLAEVEEAIKIFSRPKVFVKLES